ncbi:MAG TPA: hypothetical protein VEI97_04370 [bacterium]|nr:hypothetical protein [bacterium]
MAAPLTAAALVFLIASAAGLALALAMPIGAMVYALLACGVLHNVVELRFIGRRLGPLPGALLGQLALLLTAIAAVRFAGLTGAFTAESARALEIALGYGLLVPIAGWLFHRDPRGQALGYGLGTLAAIISLALPDWHFVAIAHLHNLGGAAVLTVLAFQRRHQARHLFADAMGLVMLLVPALILAGAFEGLIEPNWIAGRSIAGDPIGLAAAYAPPGAEASTALRWLTLFAYLQFVHYALWLVVIPWLGPRLWPAHPHSAAEPIVGSRWYAPAGIIAACVFAAWMAFDFPTGRGVYAACATFHAYIELPVLLMLLAATRQPLPALAPYSAGVSWATGAKCE